MALRNTLVILGAIGAALATQAAQATPSRSTQPQPPGLPPVYQAVFCGAPGHETTAPYAQAVGAELTSRLAAGAHSLEQAMQAMRKRYCGAAEWRA